MKILNHKICAGIVLYNPKIDRLKQNVETILNQFPKLVIYNNGCDNKIIEYIRTKEADNVIVIGTGENSGIAHALNAIMRYAEDAGIEWVVTMDQDSVLPTKFASTLLSKDIEDDVAIICPRVEDSRRLKTRTNTVNIAQDVYVDKCITSASCTSVKAWKFVDGFDEFLFIDLVDNDFCKRLVLADWKILRINSLVLNQEFGEISLKGPRFVKLIKKICELIPDNRLAENVSKLAYTKNVSPLRIYYSNRNILYLNKKFKNYNGIGYESYNCRTYLGYAFFYNLASVFRGKNKTKIIKAVIKGIKDGVRTNPAPIIIKKRA